MSGSERPFAARIFLGSNGLRAGWRFVAFLLLAGAIGAVVELTLHWIHLRVGSLDPAFALGAVLATWIMARVEGRPFTSFGLGVDDRWRNLAMGIAAGFLGLTLLMGALVGMRAFRPAGPELAGAAIVEWAAYWTLAFIFTAVGEEMLTRGYALFTLSEGAGFWPAAILLSVMFGAGHIGNRGEEVIGIANAVLAGLVFAYSVRWTGTLWWALGCHFSWDWGESFFYGVADSGGVSHHHFLSGVPEGPAWLSGGSVGPEGSVLATVTLLLLAASVRPTRRDSVPARLDRAQRAASQSSNV